MNIELNENECIDDLQCNNLKLIQNNNYFKYGIDAVLLVNLAKEIKNNSTIVEFGTGNGVVSILLTAKINIEKIYAIEIQKNVADIAKRNIKLNNLQKKIELLNINLKEIHQYLPANSIDAIITNPPYQSNNSGNKNLSIEKKISRHEIFCNFEDICEKAKYLLKDKGELYIVHRPERLVDIIYNLRKYKLEPKKLQYVQSNINTPPTLILIKAVKNGGIFLKSSKPLIIYEKNGEYTNEIKKIYGLI